MVSWNPVAQCRLVFRRRTIIGPTMYDLAVDGMECMQCELWQRATHTNEVNHGAIRLTSSLSDGRVGCSRVRTIMDATNDCAKVKCATREWATIVMTIRKRWQRKFGRRGTFAMFNGHVSGVRSRIGRRFRHAPFPVGKASRRDGVGTSAINRIKTRAAKTFI